MLQEDGGGDEFLELEEVNERLRRSGQQSLESINEVLVHSEDESKSAMIQNYLCYTINRRINSECRSPGNLESHI